MISSETIKNAVYDLCVEANTTLKDSVLEKLLLAYETETNLEAKQALGLILKNAQMAQERKKPLCQDTGQVLVFVKIGEKCVAESLNKSINEGVKKAYEENFYRKSIVKNALFERVNTQTNTPCIIYTEITDGENLEIEILLKGAGSENKSQIAMLSPTSTEDEIIEFVKTVVETAGPNACPPLLIGVGIGGTMDYAALLSKKALLLEENIDQEHKKLAQKIKTAANELNIGAAGLGGASTVLDVKILTSQTHIASMPVAVTINCHSSRHAKLVISKQGTVSSKIIENPLNNLTFQPFNHSTFQPVDTSDIEALKSLKSGQNVLLSGEIYTARDMAHKKLVEMIEKGEKLPFDLKDKIIFYAGPCPCSEDEIIGSVGPTTASRMDKFAPTLYKAGILATIGKGKRSEEVQKVIKESGGIYFTAIGGIACYLADKITKKEIIAFEELGTEAIYKLSVEDFPAKIEIKDTEKFEK